MDISLERSKNWFEFSFDDVHVSPTMTKYWYTATSQNGKRLTLYVETYDAAIEHDLQQAPAGSLIHCVTDAAPASEQDRHAALALGAFTRHVAARGLAPITKIYEADSIPKSLDSFWLGGFKEPQTCTVIVFEKPVI
jgi:hypothetical protein